MMSEIGLMADTYLSNRPVRSRNPEDACCGSPMLWVVTNWIVIMTLFLVGSDLRCWRMIGTVYIDPMLFALGVGCKFQL